MNRALAIVALLFAGLAGIFVVQLVRGLLLAAELSADADARAVQRVAVFPDGGSR
jgi:predicted cobalt transporter CbtA